MRIAKPIGFVLLLVVLIPWGATGRVYEVVGDTHGRLNAVGLPWEPAYKTTMSINGQRNDVEVYSARWNEPVVEQLAAQFKLQGATVRIGKGPDGGAIGMAQWDGGKARILVVPAVDQANQMIFLFYPAKGAAQQAHSPIPEYPRGTTLKTVVNEDSKTFCASLETPDSAERVVRYYVEELSRDGWSPMLPLPLSGGMLYFHRREQTCCVLANEGNNGATTVTVLVKKNDF